MKNAFLFAFPKTLPILAGFLFLGISYGIYATAQGFHPIFPIAMSALVFAGSLEFVLINLLLSPFNPIGTFLLTLMINARHIFYGLSMLTKFQSIDYKKYYTIFGMCDDSFSINATLKIPRTIDEGWVYFHVTWLNHLYWVLGTTLGAFFGHRLPFKTDGIEFALSALFLVLFLEQLISKKQYLSLIIGAISSIVCLFIFGSNQFMIPTMLIILGLLTIEYLYKTRKEWRQ